LAEILAKRIGTRAVFSQQRQYTSSLGATLIYNSVIYDAEAVNRHMGSAGIDQRFAFPAIWKPGVLTLQKELLTNTSANHEAN
jgi:hypothetical protein